MPSLALVYIQAIVLMMVCHVSLSGISGRFIGTTSTMDTIGTIGTIGAGDTTVFGTFLFRTTSSSVLVAFGYWNLLRRL